MSIIEVKVPDIGAFASVEVIEILVAVGDSIKPEQSLITLESDKAAMEIPSPAAGVIKAIKIKVGDKIAQDAVILLLEEFSAQAAPVEQPKPVASAAQKSAVDKPVVAAKPITSVASTIAAEQKSSPTASIYSVRFSQAHASPSVRKFARELGVDLGKVEATGNKGRIMQHDVQAFVKQMLHKSATTSGGSFLGVEPMPVVDFSQWGEVEIKPLTKINKLTGKFLHRNWVNIPHVTQFDEADITDLEAFRNASNAEYKDRGIKFTMLAFIMKALAVAMKKYPRFNSSLDASGENIIMKSYFHIGIAVDTPDGLVVPVIRDVDKKGLIDLVTEMKEISLKARDKKLKPSDMQGGCMSISSLGGIGGTKFTAKLVGVVEELEKPKVYIDQAQYDEVANPNHNINSLMFVAKDKRYDKVMELKRDIEAAIASSDLNVLYVMSQAERVKIIYDHLNIILTIIVLLSCLVLMVGALGMASATSINILERTREIGVLRAIGATPGMIYQIFVTEGMIMSVASILLGLLLAWPLSMVAPVFFGTLMLGEGASLRYAFSGEGLAIVLATTLVFGWLASRVPARSAIRISTRDALAYV